MCGKVLQIFANNDLLGTYNCSKIADEALAASAKIKFNVRSDDGNGQNGNNNTENTNCSENKILDRCDVDIVILCCSGMCSLHNHV